MFLHTDRTSCVSLCAHCVLCPRWDALRCTEKSLTLLHLLPSSTYALGRSQSLPFPMLSSPSSLNLPSSPSVTSAAPCPCPLYCLSREEDSFLLTCRCCSTQWSPGCCKITLLPCVQPGILWDILCRVSSQLVSPPPVLVPGAGVIPPQVQDWCFPLSSQGSCRLTAACQGPSELQLTHVLHQPLLPLCITCKLAEGTLSPFFKSLLQRLFYLHLGLSSLVIWSVSLFTNHIHTTQILGVNIIMYL